MYDPRWDDVRERAEGRPHASYLNCRFANAQPEPDFR
jgi:hypothetical protein